MTEELTLEERLGDGGAIDGHERPATTPACPMDGLGRQLLARAALPGDEDRGAATHKTKNFIEICLKEFF